MIPPLAVVLSWPVFVYLFCRGRGPAITLLFAILGGYLFLPEHTGLDLPLFYELNKVSVPTYAALIACLVAVSAAKTGRTAVTDTAPRWLDGWFPRDPIARIFLLLILVGSVMTVVTNRDPVTGPGVYLSGLRFYDAGSSLLFIFITITPMLLARKFFARPEGQRLLLMGFFMAGMVYVPLVLFEVRMSPQLNQWLYGFFPHGWLQHVRGDGFRPIVFLYHGLRVSIFLTAALLVALGLARLSEGKMRAGFMAAAALLFVSLVLSKSLGALLVALVFCPIMLLAPSRMLVFSAAGFAAMALLYPILRGTALIPLNEIQSFAASIDAQRAQSLGTRLHFEEVLLARAQERPIFGWGGWGRSLYIGEEQAIPDGEWIIVLGRYGWAGFLGLFGLMAFPVVLLLLRYRKNAIGMESAVIASVLAASVVDLIPNSGMTPDKWLLAGALWGRLELGRVSDEAAVDPPPLRLRSRYARQVEAAPTIPQQNRYTRQTTKIKR